MLSPTRFLQVIEDTPLVSIDLLVTRPDGALLVGRRTAQPAKDWFFVPGGRIRKGERHEDALARIAEDELGLAGVQWDNACLHGVYTHTYETNALDEPGVSTHYVVIAYRLTLAESAVSQLDLPDEQHSAYRWILAEAHDDPALAAVHENTRAYLRFPDG
jgi:colanic acid biosynthesis protein WcaH